MRPSILALLASAACVLATAPAVLSAQEVVQALPGTTDADRLAEQMRALAANPRDLNALIAAADLSLSLGDLSGAASLYARAEKIAASDPRIKVGEGAILVRSERPGEALRYFAQAEAAGADPRGFAGDRGLAYDLIGQQERAQRDYRLALKTRPDDEIVKRYALSLGISGKRDAALEQLDPLLRKTDRSAWRIRAFILAMGGDQAGAEKIATTMLPAGMAQGLLPFFQRLPTLPAADRAFAVHFGEVHSTPERIADARLAPALPYLAPEVLPVAVAAAQPAPAVQTGKRRRSNGRDERVALAANSRAARSATPAPTPTPAPVAAAAVAPPPSYQQAAAALTRIQPLPTTTRAPVTYAGNAPAVPVRSATPTPTPTPATTTAPVQLAAVQPRTTLPAAVPSPTRAPATSYTPAAAGAATPATATAVTNAPAPGFTSTPAATVTPSPAPVASIKPTPAPGFVSAPATATTQTASTPATTPAAAPNFTAPPSRAEADSVLARIVAGLSIPASELGVVEPARAAPATVPPADTAARVLAEAKAKEERDAAAERALAAQAVADKRVADRKAAADKKALAAKKLADEKKAADAKAAAEERKAAAEEKRLARANPARIWVQVAGGANENDLAKAYSAVKAKAPAVFGSRSAWTTPLRATNRVLVGPFKTDAEARSFVNQLKKEGVSTFTFTSDAGQVVSRLGSGGSSGK